MKRGGCIYIMTNEWHTLFYVGVTANLPGRISEHKQKINIKSFTARYNIVKLVYYEIFDFIKEAIVREKQVKKYTKSIKIKLIEKMNPRWNDLYDEIKYW